MDKSMLMGVVAGVAIATAGGVAAYTYLGQEMEVSAQDTAFAVAEQTEQAAVSQPTTSTASAPAAVEECWDEEVTVQADPRDEHRIAGTTAGALIGGALAKKLGDDNDLVTAAGAAAGAYGGRRAQGEYQENNTETTIERRCAPASTR